MNETQRRKRNERARRHYAANREQILAAVRERRAGNLDAVRQKERVYARIRRAADPELRDRQNARVREWKTANPAHVHVQSLRIKAKRRGLEWTLPEPLALDLVTDNCFYCGAIPAPTNGIDRVDNARGYIEDNVVTSCRPCNVAKLDRPLSDFAAWVRRACAHQERYAIA